ncbi:MAG: Ger(x)C family spore germination protein [Kurthia sp.]|nr:Ger(x)C family spore germination protein [Candidatus Kurthia equi]
MIKNKGFTFLLLSPLLLAACWDKVEVEERGFVSGIAIDMADSSSKMDIDERAQPQIEGETRLQQDENLINQNPGEDYSQNKNSKFKLTQQLIVPSGLVQGQNSGGNTMPAFRNLSQTGNTIIEMNRDMIKQAGRITNVTHLNVVLFSEAVATEAGLFEDLMDIFLREKEMLRSVKVAITKDHAGDYLYILPENEKIPGMYIAKLLENKSNLEIAQPITVGDIQALLLSKKSFAIPILNIVNTSTINYMGLSIYNGKKNKIVGMLTSDNAKGVNFINSKDQTGTLNIKFNNNDITFEILKVNSKISLKNKDKNHLKFHITINVKAGIAEQYGSLDIMDESHYKELKKALEKEITQMTTNTVSILQEDVQTDLLGLNTHLYKYHYPLWSKVKDDWEDGQAYFIKSNVNIDVNVTIEKPGNILKSH